MSVSASDVVTCPRGDTRPRQRQRTCILAGVEVEHVDDVVHVHHLLAARHRLGQPQPRRVLERLAQRQVREEDVLLQHVADAPLPPLRQPLAVQADAARVQLGAARQAVEQRRLSTACNTVTPRFNF